MKKVCSFIGHRNVEASDILNNKIKNIVEKLIIENDVDTFLFGSKSKFNDYCLMVVGELKKKYPFIKRIGYACNNESYLLESDKILFDDRKNQVKFYPIVDEIYRNPKFGDGRAKFVKRNFAMIDSSDYCVFYFSECYLPPKMHLSPNEYEVYQPKSGTSLAYNYAKEKRKIIMNLFED